MSSEPLNSNPEILLKKRKDADRLRLVKQEAARERLEKQRLKKLAKKTRFVRAETLVSQNRLNDQQQYRVKRILQKEKLSSLDKPKLVFVLRIPGPSKTVSKIPLKIKKILQILKLNSNYTGVFVRLTPSIEPLLRICSQYLIIGEPSLNTIRLLLQKRAKVDQTITEDNTATTSTVPLNNAIVEEKLGEEGLICIEDLIHEIYNLGENFKAVVNILKPFKLEAPVHGWGPLNKLKRIELRTEAEGNKLSNSGSSGLNEVDIDTYITEQI